MLNVGQWYSSPLSQIALDIRSLKGDEFGVGKLVYVSSILKIPVTYSYQNTLE